MCVGERKREMEKKRGREKEREGERKNENLSCFVLLKSLKIKTSKYNCIEKKRRELQMCIC